MRIVSYQDGFKVIDIESGKTLYKSFSRIDCEQYTFGKYMLRKERRHA